MGPQRQSEGLIVHQERHLLGRERLEFAPCFKYFTIRLSNRRLQKDQPLREANSRIFGISYLDSRRVKLPVLFQTFFSFFGAHQSLWWWPRLQLTFAFLWDISEMPFSHVCCDGAGCRCWILWGTKEMSRLQSGIHHLALASPTCPLQLWPSSQKLSSGPEAGPAWSTWKTKRALKSFGKILCCSTSTWIGQNFPSDCILVAQGYGHVFAPAQGEPLCTSH